MKYILYIYAMLVFLAVAGCSNDYIYPDTSNMPHGYSLKLQKDLEDEWIKIAEDKGLDTRYEWRIELREFDKDGKVIYRGEPRTSSNDNLSAVDSIVYKCYTNPMYNETTPSHVVCKFKTNNSFTINKYYPGSYQIILSPGVNYNVIDPDIREKIYYYGFDISDELGAILDERVSALGYSSSKVELSVTEKDIDGNVLSQRNDFKIRWSAVGAYYADVTITVGQDVLRLSVNNIKIPDIPKGTKYILSTSDNYVIEELAPQLYYYGIRWDGRILGVIDEIGESMGGYWISSSIECFITEKDSEGNALKTFSWSGKGITTTDNRTIFIEVTLRAKGSKQKYGHATDLFNLHFKNLKLVDIMSSDRKTPYTLTSNDQYEIEYLINQ